MAKKITAKIGPMMALVVMRLQKTVRRATSPNQSQSNVVAQKTDQGKIRTTTTATRRMISLPDG